MKKTALIILTCLCLNPSYSQDVSATITTGPTFDLSKNGSFERYFGTIGDYHYALIDDYGKGDITPVKWKEGEEATVGEEFDLKETIGKNHYHQGSILFGEQLMYFVSEKDKSTKTYRFKYTTIDPDDLTLGSSTVELGGVDYAGLLNDYGTLSYALSPDKSKLVVLVKDYILKEGTMLRFKLFDTDLHLLWEEEMEFPMSIEIAQGLSKNLDVDNDGNVFLIGRFMTMDAAEEAKGLLYDMSDIVEATENSAYRLISILNEGAIIQDTDLDQGSYYITDAIFDLTESPSVVKINALTSGSSTGIYCKGICTLEYAPDTETTTEVFATEFSEDFITLDWSDKELKRADEGKDTLERYSYYMDHVIYKDDGSSIWLAEEYYVTWGSSVDSKGRITTYPIYNVGHIMALLVSETGDITTATEIPKYFSSRYLSKYSSYLTVIDGDDCYLVFNDDDENEEDPDMELLQVGNAANGDGIITVCKIDNDGTETRDILFELEKEDGQVAIGVYGKHEGNAMLFIKEKKTAYVTTIEF